MSKRPREPFLLLRIFMAISSLSPLFVLIMAKGSSLIPDVWLVAVCTLIILVSTLFVGVRVWVSKNNKDKKRIAVSSIEDSRDHLLVYLFSVLVPLFQADLDTSRNLFLFVIVFFLVIFLFIHLRLYYANVFFAIFGYKVFTLTTEEGERVALLSKRETIKEEVVFPYRVSNFLYIDAGGP